MSKADGTFTYPMSSQKDVADAGSNYDNILSEFSTGTAFRDVTVNPILKTTHVTSETTNNNVEAVSSVIFTEIRKGPHADSISNDLNSQIGNRILPVNTTKDSHGTAKDTSAPFKIKVYDSEESASTNRKFVYSTIDSPATDTLGIDIDNYDYFIMLNPSIIQDTGSTTQTSVRPHFAKITGITTFNEFGDGLEFSPKYPVPVPKGTQFEVFKGPHKINDSDVVAVSYGLRGDANANTDNYDVLNVVSKPTFYFYNDRLEQDDQLDYMEKYTLTRMRWLTTLSSTAIIVTNTDAHDKYEEGSSSARFTVAPSDISKLCEGMSLFNSNNEFLGNIKDRDTANNYIQLDFARIAIAASSSTLTYRIGRGIQNVVFRTESRIKGTIPNIGRQKLDAVLVDNLRNTDDSDSNFNPSFWRKSFVNMRRHEQDSTTVTVNDSHFDGELNGPARYITSDPRPFSNDKISPMSDIVVNNPRNRMSKIAKMIALNNSGMLPHKIERGKKLKVLNTKFSDKCEMKKLPVLVSKTNGANTITFTEIDASHDYKLSEKLPTDSILEIGDYHYVVDSFANKSNSSQVLTTKARKTLTENTFTLTTDVHDFTNLEVKVVFWTGVLNTDTFDSETDVIYADNHRLSVSDSTVKKENTKFFNSRVNFTSLTSHENLVDFIDRNMKYVKIQDASRKFYQSSNIERFYYYDGSYSLQEEVFSGVVESTDNTTENGLSTMVIEGRDDSALLLNKIVNRNLVHTEDLLFSSLNPVVPLPTTYVSLLMVLNSVNDRVIEYANNNNLTPKKYMLLFRRSATANENGTFIGEVESVSVGAFTTELTLTHKPLIDIPSTVSALDVYVYDPFEDSTYLSGVKAIGSNPALTSSTDFEGTSDKGLVFQDGLLISRASDGTLSTSNLRGTSNSGSYLGNRTLGYGISKPISIDLLNDGVSSPDSTFAIKPSNETGVSFINSVIPSYASETFDVVQLTSKDDGGATMTIAPRCPLIMGRLENNTSDSRSNYSFYFVNNNISSGGFLHRIDTLDGDTGQRDFLTDDVLWTPRETYRYWDMQRFDIGSLTKNKARAYNKAKSAITGYAISYPIMGNGHTPATSTRTASSAPVLGSNMIDSDFTLSNTSNIFLENPPKDFVRTSPSTTDARFPDVDFLLNYHPKAQNYEIFSTGDLYPYSKLRYNNIGYSTLSFNNLSCLLESSSRASSTSNGHSSYTGKTFSNDRKDSDYEKVTIKSADKTTNQIKRFGVARLVEATFDWHFNPIDPDDLPTETPVQASYYQMFKKRESITNLQVSKTSSGNPTITFDGGGTITVDDGQVFFDANTGRALLSYSSVLSTTISSGGTISASDLNNISGETSISSTDAYTIKQYDDTKFRIESFSDGFEVYNAEDNNVTDVIDFSSVYLVRPNLHTSGFRYSLLEATNGADYDPPNVFLPLIFKSKTSASATAMNVADQSPYHPDGTWHTLNSTPYYHSSRVLAALQMDRGTSSLLIDADKYSIENDVHPYENCIAVFRNIRKVSSEGPNVPSDMFQTSATLGSREEVSAHDTFFAGGVDGNFDQHTPNTMVFRHTDGNAYAISGTHTRSRYNAHTGSGNWIESDNGAEYFLSELNENELTTSRTTNSHIETSSSSSGGGVYQAQMMIKPVFDFDADDITISGRTITFASDENDFKHSWLLFVPDLTGYYIVAERMFETKATTSLGNLDVFPHTDTHELISKSPEGGNILTIAKIIRHEISGMTSANDGTHDIIIELDKQLPSTTSHTDGGPRYRLMKLAETTFRDTPNEIIFNRLHATGLDYSLTTSNFASGTTNPRTPSSGLKGELSEGVYSAYVLMNTDVAPNTHTDTDSQTIITDNHLVSSSNLPYSDGDTFDAFITDGTNSSRKTMTVSLSSASRSEGRRKAEHKLTFDGTLTGNGVVSFGEVINLELDTRPDLGDVSVCHIGTSMTIGSEAETEIERIAKEAGMTTDTIQTQSIFTGNIVSSVSNNIVTCKNAVVDIEAGDVIYTHEGLPVGEVASVSGSDITFNDVHTDIDIDLWYTPLVNDELIKREKKTFIATNNFTEVSAFDAINTLASKKEMDFNVKGKHIDFRKLNVLSGLVKKKINYKNNRIFRIDTSSELFAKANKVTVVGDRVSAIAQVDEEGTELTFVDSTIKTRQDARVKANELLELHNEDTRKITLRLERKGLETLDAGDVVELDFPAQGIENNKYVIFEIENVLTSQITMTVGTFSKTIAERLSELGSGQRENTATTFTKNSISVTGDTLLKDSLKIRVMNVNYVISGTGAVSNVGFGAKVGFFDDGGSENADAELDSSGTEVGFSRQSVGVLLNYDSED